MFIRVYMYFEEDLKVSSLTSASSGLFSIFNVNMTMGRFRAGIYMASCALSIITFAKFYKLVKLATFHKFAINIKDDLESSLYLLNIPRSVINNIFPIC